MKLGSRISGVLLIMIVIVTNVIATTAAATFAEDDHFSESVAQPSQNAAGCHAHRDKNVPSPRHELPGPANYQCCLTGHDAAIVISSDLAPAPAQCMHVFLPAEVSPDRSSFPGLNIAKVFSAHPPALSPLRI